MNRAFSTARLPVFYASGGPSGDGAPDLAPGGLPEWEDIKTANDPAPYALQEAVAPPTVRGPAPPPHESLPPFAEKPASFVRVRSAETTVPIPTLEWAEACAFLDAMGELQLNLQVNLHCLENSVEAVSYDRSANAAAETLRTRIQELTDLRDALNELYIDANEPAFAPLFGGDAPFTAYLKGLYHWSSEVTAALTGLSNGLRVLQPDWSALRSRLDHAATWYFDGLPNEIRPEVERYAVRPEFAAKIEEVFFAARYLAHGLEKKFG